jgi:polyvinyl alcohol dehydrogenase (cytochrome)
MNTIRLILPTFFTALILPATPLLAEDPHPGEAPYMQYCASCHDGGVYKSPSRFFLSMIGPENILNSMTGGTMTQYATALEPEQLRAIAEYVTGRSLVEGEVPKAPPACDDQHGFDPGQTPAFGGWGNDLRNSRSQSAEKGGLTVKDVPGLEVKWAFAYPNAAQARSQPAVAGGAVYFGSQDGTVRALDAKTGCLRWAFKANAEVRTGIVISPWNEGDDPSPTLYFGDLLARAYAVDAITGELRWIKKVDDHPDATITGTPTLAGDRLFVPISSLEVVPAMNPDYPCCSFRGAIMALDANSGEVLWKNYSVDKEPVEVGRNRVGTPMLAPSGAPFWNSPTVDLKRGQVYGGSGENYTSPADGNSDAIIAFDMETGERRWVSQQTRNDAWNVACVTAYTDDRTNCPAENGPDYDFGASSILVSLEDGREFVVAGQKSGHVAGIDPNNGQTLWKTPVGRGGIQGGILFGMAAEGDRIYVPISDMFYPEDLERFTANDLARPGLYAINAETGALLWSSPAPDVCGDLQDCDPGIGQAITAIPGAVIAGHFDGRLRIYSSEDGKMLWELNTLREFDTVSGEKGRGGSFSGGGPVVANGMIYVNSGYGMYMHMPGNVLLAIGPAD